MTLALEETFDLRTVAREQAFDYHALIQRLRQLPTEPIEHSAIIEIDDRVLHRLRGVVELPLTPCPDCLSTGTEQVPVAALEDGAIYRVDYHCYVCDRDFPIWWED